MLTAAIAVAATLPFTSAAAASARHTATHNIIQYGFTMDRFAAADPAAARYWMDRRGAYATVNPGPYGATTSVHAFGSLSSLAKIGPGLPHGSWVLFDIETWPVTPLAEQQNPGKAMEQFNTAATRMGLRPIDAPAMDLAYTDTACSKKAHGGSRATWYIECRIAAYAVSDGGDGVIIQSQSHVGSPDFGTLVRRARDEIMNVNPAAFIDADVSVNHGTAAQAVASLTGVGRHFISGIFVTDNNANAANPRGWEAKVLNGLMAKGW
ncbi:MAG TPA: hypothetical protein VMH35_10935 [Streptosporangiaceae bacterium]|nr:hypothetical protein [Streptosporangiaceae bacterium]